VGKPKRSSKGFSTAEPAPISKKQLKTNSEDHIAKEQEAQILISQGNLQRAEEVYRELIAAGTNNYIVYGNLAIICGIQSRHDELIALLKKTIELNPNHPEAHYNLGIGLKHQGNITAAIASYKTALQLNPNHPEAHNNLGNALTEQGDLEAAIAACNKAIELKPNYPEAYNNLGNALQGQGNLEAAIDSFNTALQLNPNYPLALYNLGNALTEQGDPEAAIASFKTALELNPNYPEANENLSMAELLAGDYKSGWGRYEYRFQTKSEKDILISKPSCKQWKGEIVKQGSKLILASEQGLGDTLQFMRYAIALQNQGIAINICAQPKLHKLIQSSGIDYSPLTPEQANQVTNGQWIPLLSVPRHLEVSPENPIITEPYIKTTDDLLEKWKSILSREGRPIIGINWQGNPIHEKTNSKGRSIPLEAYTPIASKTKASLLSLQKGFGSEQMETCSFKDHFVSSQGQINNTWDFLETAAIIANCDLVITSDTAVAHLAGGMGKTTWLLLKKVPEWRWGLEGDTTFWYPSMRLFRQRERGNWDEVMGRVAEELQKHFESNHQATQAAPAATPANKPETTQDIKAPISLGELIDKITILQIKTQHLQGTARENVKKELEALETILNNLQLNIDTTLIQRLKEVNQDLWQTEDAIRDQERQESFGKTFIHLARSVYQQNDRRAAIKKELNITYGSAFVEEKSYKPY